MNNSTAILRRIVYVIVFLHRVNVLCFCFSIAGSRLRPTIVRSVAGDDDGCGETVPSLRRGTTYSWINPKLQPKEHANKNDSQGEYKRIQFGGCGSILLHSGTSSRSTSLQHTGLSLWSAAYVMSYYIDDMWNQEMRNTEATKKWTVLDLGAGLGLCSAVAAKHGMNVISTDSDSQALVLLEENLRRNYNDDNGCISVHVLDWIAAAEQADTTTNPVFEELEKYGGPELVILSDVIYSATKPAWKALIVLLQKLRSQRMRLQYSNAAPFERKRFDSTNTPASDPYVLLGYTQRRRDMSPQDEAEFFTMLRNAGMEAVLVPPCHIPNAETYMLTTLLELRWVD
mmetsp:Transcript_6111/g.9518  ORF Transcript_6111/g.9518 Transcript_6111/m.9518 type:complete len:342 (-) Transcript_6111:1492-2517(-)